jgi:signal transduction histidine kinase
MTAGIDGERMSVLVHEVRSPVAALAAVAEAAAESPGDGVDLPQLVRLALAACRAIERVVFDVSVASVRLERLDVSGLIRDAVATHVVRGADVAGHVDDGMVVDGDAVRLRQAIDNLLANALSHGGDAPVAVRATEAGGVVRIAISDAGPGIPTDELERVFEVGTRLNDDGPGSGLGLPLARAIAEAHGGSLVAVSAAGEGATFVIALPTPARHPDTAASST